MNPWDSYKITPAAWETRRRCFMCGKGVLLDEDFGGGAVDVDDVGAGGEVVHAGLTAGEVVDGDMGVLTVDFDGAVASYCIGGVGYDVITDILYAGDCLADIDGKRVSGDIGDNRAVGERWCTVVVRRRGEQHDVAGVQLGDSGLDVSGVRDTGVEEYHKFLVTGSETDAAGSERVDEAGVSDFCIRCEKLGVVLAAYEERTIGLKEGLAVFILEV